MLIYEKLIKTYSETIKSRDLISRALKRTSLKLDAEDVLNNLTVATVTDTQILQIKYISTSPKEAKVVIEKVSDEFIETSKKLVPNGNIQIIEAVELPENPISPNKKMNIAIAFLLVLPSGKIIPNPSEMLSSKTMGKLLETLKDSFDYIILDTPPVQAVTDLQILSTKADGKLY